MKIKKFVKRAPQYQQMPQNFHLDTLWRATAGWLYFLRQCLSIKPSFVRDMLRLLSIKNLRRGEECIIIGGGPSSKALKKNQYKALKDKGLTVFVLNNFWLSPLAKFITPDFILISDPSYSKCDTEENRGLRAYLNANPSIHIISPTSMRWTFPNAIYTNGLSATGLWKGKSPLLPSTTIQGVFFDALKISIYLGFSRIYVSGIEHSFYLNHKHLGAGELVLDLTNLHSYDESGISLTNPYLTRGMSDVLYAQAILLRDLKTLAKNKDVINVGLKDFTNDAFPMACLLPK